MPITTKKKVAKKKAIVQATPQPHALPAIDPQRPLHGNGWLVVFEWRPRREDTASPGLLSTIDRFSPEPHFINMTMMAYLRLHHREPAVVNIDEDFQRHHDRDSEFDWIEHYLLLLEPEEQSSYRGPSGIVLHPGHASILADQLLAHIGVSPEKSR